VNRSQPQGGDPGGQPNPGDGGKRMGWRPFRWTLAIAIAVAVAAVRWMAAAHLHIGKWAEGVPTAPGSYIFIIIAVVLLIAPEASSISLGGLKLEMLRQNKAEIERVGERVHQLQIQQASAAAAATARAASNSSGNNVYIVGDAKAAAALRGSVAATTAVAAGEAAPVPDGGAVTWASLMQTFSGADVPRGPVDLDVAAT
jgi:hypothetical protein